MNRSERKGFTLVELLIVIVVIGILAAMMMLSSTESVTTAKASNIIANLTSLKKATLAWYMDNRSKIYMGDDKNMGSIYAVEGQSAHPIQQWQDKDLGISKYFSGMNSVKYNENFGVKGSGKSTELKPGCYGIYDAGTNQRTEWFVGYAFADGEDRVRDKVKGRAKQLGLSFTDKADPDDVVVRARENAGKPEEEWRLNGEHAVWLHVLSMY